MNNYTDEDYQRITQRIHQRRIDRSRREALKAIRDKIRIGIEKNKTRSGERAIWELVQNARDLSEHAIICIHLKRDAFEFAHMGEPFNIDTLSNLIKQQSTKREGQDSVGQYGTGFMTTHAFSRKVFISGDCWVEDEEVGGVYLKLPDGFCLDRTSDDEDTFIEELGAELDMVDHIIDRFKEGHPCPEPWTKFSYPIGDSEKAEKISSQLANACKLIPYVLTFNDKIQSISVTDDISEVQVSFSRLNLERESEPMFDAVCKVVTHIKKSAPSEGDSLIEVHTLESVNGNDRIVIPPLPIGFNDVTCIPSQFLFFPLLGTENFGTNFIFHSSRLYPTEERNSYILPQDNDAVVAKYKHNEQVLGELFNMLFSYYSLHPQKQCLPLDFAKVSFARSETEVPDTIQRDYLNGLQKTFVDHFIHWAIIPTGDGYKSIQDYFPLQVLSHDIYSGLTDEQLEVFMPPFAQYASMLKTLPMDNLVEWSKVVYEWKPDEKSYYITLEDVCKTISKKDNNLMPLLKMLKALGQTGTNLMEQYALIPNREGVLQKSVSLKNAKDITPDLYAIAKPILGNRAALFVDPAFSDLVSFVSYTRKNLRDDLKVAIDEIRDKTHKRRWPYYRSSPICLSDSDLVHLSVDDLITFCSAFPIETPQNYRANVMKALCKILGKEFKPVVIPAVESDEVDMYSNSFNYLLDDTMFSISMKDQDWLSSKEDGEEHLADLVAFVKELVNTQDEDKKKKLDDYGIIPNRLLEMCLPKGLKKSTTPIPESVLDLYNELTDILDNTEISNYRSVLVHEDFADFYNYSECKASDITFKMEEMLRDKDEDYSLPETRTIVLKIIENIDSGEWPDVSIFRDIRDKKTTIFFKNTVSGEKGKHVYTLLRQRDDILENLAEMTSDPDFESVIACANDIIKQRKDEESDFQFKKAIGNHIEALLRKRLGDSVGNEDFQFPDIQNGQDIVVFFKNKPIFFIEVKTKWNFTSSGPAYMSKNQVLKACENKDCYALCCVDLTNYNLSDRSYPETIDYILDRIKIKFDIGDNLLRLMKPSLEANSADSENNISIDGDFKARIPAGSFRTGDMLDVLVSRIIEQSNKEKKYELP